MALKNIFSWNKLNLSSWEKIILKIFTSGAEIKHCFFKAPSLTLCRSSLLASCKCAISKEEASEIEISKK